METNFWGKVTLSSISIGVAAFLTWLFGELDDIIYVLALMMVVDLLLGIITAGKRRELSSKSFRSGLVRKISSTSLIILAVSLDRLTGEEWVFRTLSIWSLIVYEWISIIEHLVFAGVPIPEKIVVTLLRLRSSIKPMSAEEIQDMINKVEETDKILDIENQKAIERLEELKRKQEEREMYGRN